MPDNYIRKQTLANAERYITPELKEYESLVLNADERRLEIEQQLFREVCAQVAGRRRDAAARRPRRWRSSTCTPRWPRWRSRTATCARRWTTARRIEIVGGRHPVVELTLTDEPFVPNDTHLTPEAGIHVLTGPNMAGKSTFCARWR